MLGASAVRMAEWGAAFAPFVVRNEVHQLISPLRLTPCHARYVLSMCRHKEAALDRAKVEEAAFAAQAARSAAHATFIDAKTRAARNSFAAAVGKANDDLAAARRAREAVKKAATDVRIPCRFLSSCTLWRPLGSGPDSGSPLDSCARLSSACGTTSGGEPSRN